MSIVPEPYVPPIWRPLLRYRVWSGRRLRAKVEGDFSLFLLPIIKGGVPSRVLNEIVNVQPIGTEHPTPRPIAEQEERLAIAQEVAAQEIASRLSDESVIAWSVVYRSRRWYRRMWRWLPRLWRWAKGSGPSTGCCR